MSRNNKGYETQHRIIEAAKELFYEKGLEATKIKEICQRADIWTGNFKYYFDNKYRIANAIFSELLMKAYVYTVHYTTDRKLNALELNFRATIIYFQIIFSKEENVRYYYETLKKESVYNYMNSNVRRIYQRIVKEFNLKITDDEFDYLTRADSGIRREFAIDYLEEKPDYTIETLVSRILKLLCRLFTIDDATAEKCIQESFAFVDSHDFSHLKLLI